MKGESMPSSCPVTTSLGTGQILTKLTEVQSWRFHVVRYFGVIRSLMDNKLQGGLGGT